MVSKVVVIFIVVLFITISCIMCGSSELNDFNTNTKTVHIQNKKIALPLKFEKDVIKKSYKKDNSKSKINNILKKDVISEEANDLEHFIQNKSNEILVLVERYRKNKEPLISELFLISKNLEFRSLEQISDFDMQTLDSICNLISNPINSFFVEISDFGNIVYREGSLTINSKSCGSDLGFIKALDKKRHLIFQEDFSPHSIFEFEEGYHLKIEKENFIALFKRTNFLFGKYKGLALSHGYIFFKKKNQLILFYKNLGR